jgi:hypothetical protein
MECEEERSVGYQKKKEEVWGIKRSIASVKNGMWGVRCGM